MAISGQAQRHLQKKIDEALADETNTYRVEKAIERATNEYNQLLIDKPELCDAGLTGYIYNKLLGRGFILPNPPKKDDE